MSTVLVDTNVVSFLFRGNESSRRFLPLLAGHNRAVSFQTVAELYVQQCPDAAGRGLTVFFACNGVRVSDTHVPQDGDEVAFLPPFGGG